MKTYDFYYKRGVLKKVINIAFVLVAFLGKLIPKKKGVYLFGSMYGYNVADNSKYLYRQTESNSKYFIIFNKELLNDEEYSDYNLIYARSLKGIVLQLRAEKVFFTHGIFDFLPYLIAGSEKHNLWHGVPLKEIGPYSDWANDCKVLFYIKVYFYKLVPHAYYMSCDYVYCPFESRVEDYHRYFMVSNPKVVLKKQAKNVNSKHIAPKKKILYAPTHRSMYFSDFDFEDYFSKIGLYDELFINSMKETGFELVIRPHPVDKVVFEGSALSSVYKLDLTHDLYATLADYALVITDYSSIYLDCLERGTECISIAADYDEYVQKAGELSESLVNDKSFDNLTEIIPILKRIEKKYF